MRLSDDNHEYNCTLCGDTGGVCMQALALSRRMAEGLAANADRLPDGFELTSQTEFTGCARTCHVRLQVVGTTVSLEAGQYGAAVHAHPHPVRSTAVAG